jgi:hypothetical protein
MANYKVVDADKLDQDLRGLADAIRAKKYTSAPIDFKDMADEISTISGAPIVVSTEADMNARLETAQIGDVYRYVGPTGVYERDALYVVEGE